MKAKMRWTACKVLQSLPLHGFVFSLQLTTAVATQTARGLDLDASVAPFCRRDSSNRPNTSTTMKLPFTQLGLDLATSTTWFLRGCYSSSSSFPSISLIMKWPINCHLSTSPQTTLYASVSQAGAFAANSRETLPAPERAI